MSIQAFHEKEMGPLLFPFLSKEDRNALRSVSINWTLAKRTFEIEHCYKALQDRITKNQVVFVQRGESLRQEMLGPVLGTGGSKKAIAIAQGRVLMVPNMDVESLYRVLPRWQRMVYEETIMSRLLQSMQLLTPHSLRVRLFFSEEANAPSMPAYISESFASLRQTRGWHVIDAKNSASSTWRKGIDHLFAAECDGLDETNWDSVLEPLLNDIATLSMYDLGIGGDCLNLAVLRKSASSHASPYELRYFGFDLSHASVRRSIPPPPILNPDPAQVRELLDNALSIVFDSEFGPKYANTSPEYTVLNRLKQQLVDKSVPAILSKINTMQRNSPTEF